MSGNVVQMYEAREKARAFAAAELAKAYPWLVKNEGNSLVSAAKNIRIELGRAFPEVKFSVKSRRFSGGDAIDVRWVDGPTTDQVDLIINRYSAGSFDGMTDSYTYERSAWTAAFGDAKYVHSSREYSDQAIASAIRTVAARYAGNIPAGEVLPTVEDYRMGRIWNRMIEGMFETWAVFVNRELSRRTWSLERRAA